MLVTRLYADAEGVSHFEDIDIPLADGGPIGQLSALVPATGVILRETDEHYDYDWHTAPRRQFIITLEGAAEIEAGDGERRRFGPGTIILAEDTTGRGHRTRDAGGGLRRTIFVTLD